MVDNNQHSLIDGISNYIRMNNSGALMITGNWGCGKTFFIKNTVIPSVVSFPWGSTNGVQK